MRYTCNTYHYYEMIFFALFLCIFFLFFLFSLPLRAQTVDSNMASNWPSYVQVLCYRLGNGGYMLFLSSIRYTASGILEYFFH
jgi:hypothetical protein